MSYWKKALEPILEVHRRHLNPKPMGKVAKWVVTFLAWYVVGVSILISYKFYLLIKVVASGGKLQ